MYRRLAQIARDEKIQRIVSTMLGENREMCAICQKLGFRIHTDPEEQTVKAELEVG